MRLIVLNGAKNSGKELVARRLAENSDCKYIKPFTDHPRDNGSDDEYIRLNKPKLDNKLDSEVEFCITEVNGYRYVFFENQLNAGYVVLIGDDMVVSYLKRKWKGDLITVKVHSNNEKYSERFLLGDDDFDIVFNVDNDDIDELEELVGDIYHFRDGDDL